MLDGTFQVRYAANLGIGDSVISVSNAGTLDGSTLHALPTIPVTYGSTETPFSAVELSTSELTKLTSLCQFIQSNGSGFGICKSCKTGGLGASNK
jgi:hypothetical protein